MARKKIKICLVSLGCPKNLVDSEVIASHLLDGRMEIVYEPAESDVVVVNTCGFIQVAVDESEQTIQDLCRLKAGGVIRGVVVVGCLVQRFGTELLARLPAVDAFLPISDYSGLVGVIRGLLERGGAAADPPPPEPPDAARFAGATGGRPRTATSDLSRALLTASHTAYLRIAEGCNHRCAFCTIPEIRGRLSSKPIPLLVDEARGLAEAGVKELNLVAEDTTDYGRDLDPPATLAELLQALARIPKIRWIRILYAFPSHVTDALIETIAGNPKVLPYLDVPIQHYNDAILESMRRRTPPELLDSLVTRLRDAVPEIVLRTSVIIGYPGETEERFEELFRFLQVARFERLGAFAFSPEPGTAAAGLDAPRPSSAEVTARIEKVMTFQKTVIEECNIALVGREADVIVDSSSNGCGRGRTKADAPDIDCSVVLSGPGIESGVIIPVRFTGYSGYDLIAEPLRSSERAGRSVSRSRKNHRKKDRNKRCRKG